MSATLAAPAGWSWARFESVAADTGSWLWGTVQGAFNEKASLSQIVVDAVVGMIPLVGDATAVRDLIAVTIGLVDEPRKRDDKWQWILLVVLLFALIPVIGGVIKGTGRLTIKAAAEATHLAGAARVAHMQQAVRDIVAFLNRVGVGHAEKWLLKLNFVEHQAAILQKFDNFIYTVNGTLVQIERKLSHVLGEGLKQRVSGVMHGLEQIHAKAQEMIPRALKDLNETLKELQQYVRSGGETTSRATAHAAAAGDRAVLTYADELRLMEGAHAVRSPRGGWAKNPSLRSEFEAKGLYKHEAGYPDLLARSTPDPKNPALKHYTNITTYSGKIVNRELEKGEQIFRVFGPVEKNGVHGYKQADAARAAGDPKFSAKFWGLGGEPKNAEQWRKYSGAVLDEWNHDGFILVGTVEESGKVKACTGKIAEQTGQNIPGQYLPGGGKQAMIETPSEVAAELNALADKVMADGKPRSISVGGFKWEIKPTGWTDVNGIHGYDLATGKAAVQTVRLGAREQATKTTRDTSSMGQH